MFDVIEEKIAVPLMLVITALVLGGIFWSVNLAEKDFEKATEYTPIVKSDIERWDVCDIKVGDKVGEMTVVSVDSIGSTQVDCEVNIVIKFEGEVELTGDISPYPREEIFGDEVIFYGLDRESQKKLPPYLAKDDLASGHFNYHFEDQEFAKSQFGNEGGKATILINGYTFRRFPSEGADSINLSKVINYNPTANWQTYRNEEFGFEFKYPEGWEVVNEITGCRTDPCKENYHNVALENKYNTTLSLTVGYNPTIDRPCSAEKKISYSANASNEGEVSLSARNVYIEADECPGGVNNITVINAFGDPPEPYTSFNIALQFDGTKEGEAEMEKLFEQILSTFKFIEPQDLNAEIIEGANYSELVLKKSGEEISLYRAEQNADNPVKSETLTSFAFSPDKNYLTFLVAGWEWNTLYVYNIFQEKIVFEEVDGGTYGFIEDEQYFYNCIGDGIGAGKGFVYEVPGFEKVFDLREALADKDYSFIENCNYNKDKNIIDFTLIHQDTSTFESTEEIISYSFETNNLVE